MIKVELTRNKKYWHLRKDRSWEKGDIPLALGISAREYFAIIRGTHRNGYYFNLQEVAEEAKNRLEPYIIMAKLMGY